MRTGNGKYDKGHFGAALSPIVTASIQKRRSMVRKGAWIGTIWWPSKHEDSTTYSRVINSAV